MMNRCIGASLRPLIFGIINTYTTYFQTLIRVRILDTIILTIHRPVPRLLSHLHGDGNSNGLFPRWVGAGRVSSMRSAKKWLCLLGGGVNRPTCTKQILLICIAPSCIGFKCIKIACMLNPKLVTLQSAVFGLLTANHTSQLLKVSLKSTSLLQTLASFCSP